MTVQDVDTVTVPLQAGPADAPLPPAPVAAAEAAPLTGRDRPLTVDERQFALGLMVMALVLGAIVVCGLLVAQHAWT